MIDHVESRSAMPLKFFVQRRIASNLSLVELKDLLSAQTGNRSFSLVIDETSQDTSPLRCSGPIVYTSIVGRLL